MYPQLQSIISEISEDVIKNLPAEFEKKYYGKMIYSDKNTILDSDSQILRNTIGFEVAFVHVMTYILASSNHSPNAYEQILTNYDNDNLFFWYKIKDNEILKKIDSDINISAEEIYEIINGHDKFVDKDLKKKLGQFYTPLDIVKNMTSELKAECRQITMDKLIVDPACGTGVFIVEIIKELSCFLKPQELMRFVNNNIFGYDVNPFSVIATKISILNVLIELLSQNTNNESVLQNIPSLDNIRWQNTISEPDNNKFFIVIGNPPYFKLDVSAMKEIDGYDEVIYGQPNIYSLFMHWGIKHLAKDGIMSFIVPQSIRSGLYFKKIREEMSSLRIKSILHIDSRQNVFDRAEQAVLIICLQNRPINNSKTRIRFMDGNQNVLSDFKIDRSNLMMGEENNFMFTINKTPAIYDILEKVYHNGVLLSDKNSTVKFSNGLFVWNQHKKILSDSCEDTLPIVYGASVQPLKFNYIEKWDNSLRKPYAKISDVTRPFILSGKRLLVQRTTNFEKAIRLKACLISDEFINRYNSYFLENHINFLCSNSGKNDVVPDETMYFYLGLLNSKLINIIFVSKSGNTQVSANELNLLPFPMNNKQHIINFVSYNLQNLSEHQKELDHLICDAYGLSEIEKKVIMEY